MIDRRLASTSLAGKKILIVDDDPGICSLVELILTREGAHVTSANSPEEGTRQFLSWHPDLVILDILMPRHDGFEVCEELLSRAEVPIIFLSALNREDEVVRGLTSGAVDYITKPFSPDILRARVAIALRKTPAVPASTSCTWYDDGYLCVDLDRKEVSVAGERVGLTFTEYRLLAYLIANADRLVPVHDILRHIWGPEYEDSPNYVYVYVWRLRDKLERDSAEPQYLKSEHGIGYRFVTRQGSA